MAEPITVDNGALTDYAVLVDDVVDATLGTGAKQLVGLTDATIGATTKVAAGGGVEANALRVTVASDSTGVLSVDDNGATLSVDDGAGSLTVDGTVTANLGATDNAVLDAIEADTTTIAGAVAGTEMQVDIVSAPTITVDSELTTADLDTGVGTDTRAVVGLAGTASGGAALVASGGGTEATALRVTVASDSTGVVSVDDNGSTLSVDDGAGSLTVDGSVSLAAAIPAGTNNIGDVDVLSSALPTGAATSANQTTVIGHLDGVEGLLTTIDADTGGILTAVQLIDNAIAGTEMQVDVVGALPAGTALIGQVNVAPQTTGGLTIFQSIDLDETEEEVKATAGQVYGWYIYNDAAAEVYVKLYNATAANVTVGTTTPVMTIPIPAGSAANVEFTNGLAFGTAITAAATTGVAVADTGAPAANSCVANIFYK